MLRFSPFLGLRIKGHFYQISPLEFSSSLMTSTITSVQVSPQICIASQSCLPTKQVLFLNLDNFKLIVACFDRVRITIFYSAFSSKIKSLNLMDWTFIFFFLTDMLQGLKQFFIFFRIRECQSYLLTSFFYFLNKSTE